MIYIFQIPNEIKTSSLPEPYNKTVKNIEAIIKVFKCSICQNLQHHFNWKYTTENKDADLKNLNLYIFINNNFPKTLNFLYTFVNMSGWSWCSKERLNVFKRMQTLIPCIKTSCSIIRLRFSLTAENVSLVCSVPSYMNLKTEHRMICKVLIFDL